MLIPRKQRVRIDIAKINFTINFDKHRKNYKHNNKRPPKTTLKTKFLAIALDTQQLNHSPDNHIF